MSRIIGVLIRTVLQLGFTVQSSVFDLLQI